MIDTTVFAKLGSAQHTIDRYFSTFNQGKFDQTSQLFAPQGKLFPPFEEPIQGQAAIATYLANEADGMEAAPVQADIQSLEHDQQKVSVKGKVTTFVFKVTVVWDFILDAQHRILAVRINLLASLEELIKIRPA